MAQLLGGSCKMAHLRTCDHSLERGDASVPLVTAMTDIPLQEAAVHLTP